MKEQKYKMKEFKNMRYQIKKKIFLRAALAA